MTSPASLAIVGIGVDAVDLARFRGLLERRPGIADRLFTEAERAYTARAADPTERLAARFAAKEAVRKALGTGACSWRDVEVVVAPSGAPHVELLGRAAELGGERGVLRWHLSLTHTDLVAVATVIAEGRIE